MSPERVTAERVAEIRERWNTDGFNNGPDKRKSDGKMRFWCHWCARDDDDPRGHESDCEWLAGRDLLTALSCEQERADAAERQLATVTQERDSWRTRFGLQTYSGWQTAEEAEALHQETCHGMCKTLMAVIGERNALKLEQDAMRAALTDSPHDLECHPSEGRHSERCLLVRALLGDKEE